MAQFEDMDIARCAECGKLIQKEAGRDLCTECAAAKAGKPLPNTEITNPEEYAMRFFSLPPELTRESWRGLFSDEHDTHAVTAPPEKGIGIPCERCNEHPALGHSGLCLECHLHLHKKLGEASRDLFGKTEIVMDKGLRKPTVFSTLEKKRRRTATSHFNPVGARRLKW